MSEWMVVIVAVVGGILAGILPVLFKIYKKLEGTLYAKKNKTRVDRFANHADRLRRFQKNKDSETPGNSDADNGEQGQG